MQKIFALCLILFVFLQFLNVFSRFVITDRASYEPIYGLNVFLPQIFSPWLNFDGLNYLKIATDGYTSGDLLVFFPLFPLAVAILSVNGILNPIIVGLLLVYASAFLGVYLLYRFILKSDNNQVSLRAVILLLSFPTSFFLFAYYTEALFLLLAALFFLNLEKGKYFVLAIIAMLAFALKVFGISLLLVLFYRLYKDFKLNRKIHWEIFISTTGFLTYFTYVYLKFGDPLLIFKGQSLERYGRFVGIFSPVNVVRDTIEKILRGPSGYDSVFVYPVIIIELISILFAIFMIIRTYKKLVFEQWLYCITLIFIIFFSGGLSSDLRYLILAFPFFIYLARSMTGKQFRIWVGGSLILLAILSSLYLRNYWVA